MVYENVALKNKDVFGILGKAEQTVKQEVNSDIKHLCMLARGLAEDPKREVIKGVKVNSPFFLDSP